MTDSFLTIEAFKINETGMWYSLNNRRLFCLKVHQLHVKQFAVVFLITKEVAVLETSLDLKAVKGNFDTRNGGHDITVRRQEDVELHVPYLDVTM